MFGPLLVAGVSLSLGFHDCIQHPTLAAHRHSYLEADIFGELPPQPPANCSGGLCVGMHNGPHEGGPASYPVGSREEGFTSIYNTMTVPEMPAKQDGICYYIWSDIFFGDMGLGVMNQFVPQLILGSALDSSSGPPDYKPAWHTHTTWAFGAHYFFEILNQTTGQPEGKAAYGKLFEAKAGETLFTSFTQKWSAELNAPTWTLKMGAIDDPARVSVVEVERPYMGLGVNWPVPTKTWAEANYTRMCVNSCWELYGAKDKAHLPSSGSVYHINIAQGGTKPHYPWVHKWDEDEGAGKSCASCTINESTNGTHQKIDWKISLP